MAESMMERSERWLESQHDGQKVTFMGIDWGNSRDFNGVVCPDCKTPHRWRLRAPKACRGCGIKFLYTANEALK